MVEGEEVSYVALTCMIQGPGVVITCFHIYFSGDRGRVLVIVYSLGPSIIAIYIPHCSCSWS